MQKKARSTKGERKIEWWARSSVLSTRHTPAVVDGQSTTGWSLRVARLRDRLSMFKQMERNARDSVERSGAKSAQRIIRRTLNKLSRRRG